MKKNAKKPLIIGAVILCGFYLTIGSFFLIDKHRVEQDKEPIFAFYTLHVNDGGTRFYYGPGYQIISFKRLTDSGDGYQVSKEAHFLIGYKGLQSEPDPNKVTIIKDTDE